MTRPPIDLAIVGVPKSGTTSLFAWLAAHPGVQGSSPKETYYFLDRGSRFFFGGAAADHGRRTFSDDGWEGFERFFPEPRRGRLRLEASPSSIYHDLALRALGEVRPQPLILVVLRCPAEQIRSAFYFSQNNGSAGNFVRRSATFATYVEALLSGDDALLERTVHSEQLGWYLRNVLQYNRYVEWLDRWSAVFPPDRVMVVGFDYLANRSSATMAAICERLGLDSTFYTDFDLGRLNFTYAKRGTRTRMIAQAIGRRVPRGKLRDYLVQPYRRLPAGRNLGPPSQKDSAAMQALGHHFEPFNHELATRYSVDVSSWWPRSDLVTQVA